MPNLTTIAVTATKLSRLTQLHDEAVSARARLYPYDSIQAAVMDERIAVLATELAAAQTAYNNAIAG